MKHIDPLAAGFVDASAGITGLVESMVLDASWNGQQMHVTKLLVDTPHLTLVRSNAPAPPKPAGANPEGATMLENLSVDNAQIKNWIADADHRRASRIGCLSAIERADYESYAQDGLAFYGECAAARRRRPERQWNCRAFQPAEQCGDAGECASDAQANANWHLQAFCLRMRALLERLICRPRFNRMGKH